MIQMMNKKLFYVFLFTFLFAVSCTSKTSTTDDTNKTPANAIQVKAFTGMKFYLYVMNSDGSAVTFQNSNPAVVSVNTSTGLLTALASGQSTLVLRDAAGNSSAYTITVETVPPKTITGKITGGTVPSNAVVLGVATGIGRPLIMGTIDQTQTPPTYSIPVHPDGAPVMVMLYNTQHSGNNTTAYAENFIASPAYALILPNTNVDLILLKEATVVLNFPTSTAERKFIVLNSQDFDLFTWKDSGQRISSETIAANLTTKTLSVKYAGTNPTFTFIVNKDADELEILNTEATPPAQGAGSGVYQKDITLDQASGSNYTLDFASSELKWGKLNATINGINTNDSFGVYYATYSNSIFWNSAQKVGLPFLTWTTNPTTLTLLEGKWRLNVASGWIGSSLKSHVPTMESTKVNYDTLEVTTISSTSASAKTFTLTAVDAITFTADFKVPAKVDGAYLVCSVSEISTGTNSQGGVTPLTTGVVQTDGSYLYSGVSLKLAKFNASKEINCSVYSGGSSYFKNLPAQNLNANINAGTVVLEKMF